MSQTVGIVAALSKQEAADLAEEITPWLLNNGCHVETEDRLLNGAEADVLLALGGDGLIMRVAHTFPDIPILGINLGKVGFLARINRTEWEPALKDLIDGRFKVQEGPTLQAFLSRAGERIQSAWAINDVVIRSGNQMIEVELYLDEQFVNTYPGDGMIIATPQGSTAYCMAAGGPVLAAGVRGFAVTPICAHSPIRTTLVVPEDVLVEMVMPGDRKAELILDGFALQELKQYDLLTVRKGEHSFRLIVLKEMNFYQAFRSKFNFMIRPDAIPTRSPAARRE